MPGSGIASLISFLILVPPTEPMCEAFELIKLVREGTTIHQNILWNMMEIEVELVGQRFEELALSDLITWINIKRLFQHGFLMEEGHPEHFQSLLS
jgi:hypothetical protein